MLELSSQSDRHESTKTFLTLLILTETAFLIPIFLEEYLLAFLGFVGLSALFFIFNKPENGLIFLPLFLFMPFEIPGLGGVQFSEMGTFLILLSLVFSVLLSKPNLGFEVPALLPILAILAASIFSVVNAKYYFASLKNILKYIEAFVLIFVFTVNMITKKEAILKIFISILIAASLSAVIGIIRFLAGYETRVFGLLGAGFGAYTGLSMIIAANIMIFSHKKSLRFFALSVLILLTAALILSQTRAWLLATIIAFLFVVAKIGNKKYAIAFSVFFMLIFLVVFLSLSQDLLQVKQVDLISSATEKAFQTGFASTDIQGKYVSILMRIFIWIHGFTIYMKTPILGFGIGNLRFRSFFTGELGAPSEPHVGYVDNHWLNVLYETGILGIISWIWFALVVYRACRELMKNSREDREWKLISLSLSGAMIIFLVGGMFWTLTVVHEMTVFIPFLVGLIFASHRIMKFEKLGEYGISKPSN
ncbi:MAG: O-antigen ligase family protein [bacterium]